jgi:DNA recombination protein RmuC
MTIIILSTLNVVGIGLLIYLATRKKGLASQGEIKNILDDFRIKSERTLKEEMALGRKESADSEKRLREELSNLFKGLGDSNNTRMLEFAETQNKNMEKMREVVEKRLESLQKDNSEKLEAMRVTVDEKLHETLEKRFGESFKVVSDRLEAVHKGLGEMQTLALGVGDLKKVLSNVKTRGTWGEAQLGNLIEEILTPEQYEVNVKTKKTSRDSVEFAIKLPGSDDIKCVWLPIDAKFPLEDYQRLVAAEEQGDLPLIQELSKSLETRIKSEAKDINEKYLNPPYTTDFGILFVPLESLYAEILRKPGLFEQIRRDYKVIITGPTTVQAILNSLQMGFRTLTIQKRSSEVWNLLGAVKNEFSKFGALLEKTHKKMQETSDIIEDAVTKTRTIERKLDKVQGLPSPDSDEPTLKLPKK